MSNLPEPGPRPDPRSLRASDADRDRVADVLREAVAHGRITFDELDDRLALAYSARTYADLEAVTRDLPESGAVVPAVTSGRYLSGRTVGSPAAKFSIAIMSSVKRRGPWVVPPACVALTVMGTVQFDLRQARFSEPETTIQAFTLMGGIEIIVPEDIEVEVGGIGIMAAFDHSANGPGAPGSPRLKVTGLALMGSVDVKRMPTDKQGPDVPPMLPKDTPLPEN